MKRYYLAYGSNLNISQMKMRCPAAKIVGTAILENYELLFKGSKTGSYLTIEKKKGSSVPAAVWSTAMADELALDRYEGYPAFYYKKELTLPVCGIKSKTAFGVLAFVYIMHEDNVIGVPSKSYVRTCLDGYEYFGFDANIFKKAYEESVRRCGYVR